MIELWRRRHGCAARLEFALRESLHSFMFRLHMRWGHNGFVNCHGDIRMRSDVAERLEFVKYQIRGVERAFMGGGFVHAAHDELDKLQIFFSSQPSVLRALKEVRTTISAFLKSKINARLDGEDGNHHPVAVWHSYNRMEQAIRMISVGADAEIRLTVAA